MPKEGGKGTSWIYLVLVGVLLLALVYWYTNFSAAASKPWLTKGQFDPVFDTCNRICDSGRDFVDSFASAE